MLINTRAPFLSQSVQEDEIVNLSSELLAQRLSFLATAIEVQWLGAQSQSVLSSNPLTIDERIWGPIFRPLSESTTLQSLELTRVEVSPYFQQEILRIPTLRKLTLCDAIFIPTTITLPPASIRVLVLQSLIFEQTAMEHLFRVLVNSLETLDIGTKCSETGVHRIYSILESTPLQRFATIRAPVQVLLKDLNHPFLFHAFITVLHVSAAHSQSFPSVFPVTFLPKLRHLSAPWRVAELLVPGRPVQVFRDTELKRLALSTLESALGQLGASAGNIEELEICSVWTSPHIFKLLEKHLPHLKRLRVLGNANTWYNPRLMRKCMAMEPKFGVQYAPIQEIELWMELPPAARRPHQVSRPNCQKLSMLFIPICPSLELLSFVVTPNKFKTSERDISPRCIFKLRRMANGEWEERGFGIKRPEGTRGFPTVDYQL